MNIEVEGVKYDADSILYGVRLTENMVDEIIAEVRKANKSNDTVYRTTKTIQNSLATTMDVFKSRVRSVL